MQLVGIQIYNVIFVITKFSHPATSYRLQDESCRRLKKGRRRETLAMWTSEKHSIFFFFMLPVLLNISADILWKFDYRTVRGLTLLVKARSSGDNEHVPLIQSPRITVKLGLHRFWQISRAEQILTNLLGWTDFDKLVGLNRFWQICRAEQILTNLSGWTIEWKRMGFTCTLLVHSPDLLQSFSRLPVLHGFSQFCTVCNMDSCPVRSNCIGDSFLLGFLFYLSELWALWMGWLVFSWSTACLISRNDVSLCKSICISLSSIKNPYTRNKVRNWNCNISNRR